GRRARGDRERAVRAGARPLQGVPDRRSAHALAQRLQCAAEDAGRAAGAREIPAGDHRSTETAGDGAVAVSEVLSEALVAGTDRATDADDPGSRRCDVRARSDRRTRARRRWFAARWFVAARP